MKYTDVLDKVFDAGVHGGDKYDAPADDGNNVGGGEPTLAEEHHNAEGDHGGKGLDLSRPCGCDDDTLLDGKQSQSGNAELTEQNDRNDPAGHKSRLDEIAHCGKNEHLVGKGVDELSEVGHLIVLPCDMTVDKIRKAGNYKRRQRPVDEVEVHKHQKNRNKNNTSNCKFISRSHKTAPLKRVKLLRQ